MNAAYPASDEALRLVMQKPECVRLSVTNGDNAYGSEVVETVLDPKATSADLILLSMDNRNFARSGLLDSNILLKFQFKICSLLFTVFCGLFIIQNAANCAKRIITKITLDIVSTSRRNTKKKFMDMPEPLQ